MRRPPGTRGLFRRQVGTDTDVALWNAAVIANGGTVSGGRISLVSSLVGAWKAAGCWSLMDDAWLLTAENATQALTSLKQRRLATATNSPTFTADQGYAFDGSTNYIDTGFVPSSHAVAMTGNSIRLSVYERTNVSATTYAAAVTEGTNQNIRMVPRSAINSVSGNLNCATATFASSITDSRGLTAISRTSADVYEVFRGGVSGGTVVPGTSATILPARSLYIGASNNAGAAASFRAATEGFVSVGASLSAAQEAAFYGAIQTFMTAIGANV